MGREAPKAKGMVPANPRFSRQTDPVQENDAGAPPASVLANGAVRARQSRRLLLGFLLGLGSFGLGWAVAIVSGVGGSNDVPEVAATQPPSAVVIEMGNFRPSSEVPALYEELPTETDIAPGSVSPGTVAGSPSTGTTAPPTATPSPPITADPGGVDAQLP